MKTAISISDEVFEKSEKLAKKLKVSRSKIFAMGVDKLAEEHGGDEYDSEELIARINAVCEKVDTSLDPFWKELQSRALPEDKWK